MRVNKMRHWGRCAVLAVGVASLAAVVACSGGTAPAATPTTVRPAPTAAVGQSPTAPASAAAAAAPTATSGAQPGSGRVNYTPDVAFTLVTAIGTAGLAFKGQGGAIEGIQNPDLEVQTGATVQVTLVNGDGILHNIFFPDFQAQAEDISNKGASSVTAFVAATDGRFDYYCAIPGHKEAGMKGTLIVGAGVATEVVQGASVVRDPTDLPGPLPVRGPSHATLDLETVEVVGQLADGSTYAYWTFNGAVPGPFLRIRVGDDVTVNLTNSADSKMVHSVDFHAVTGPGGGATVTQTAPGLTTTFNFKALNPGLFVYHCATPMVANHIANGMYGLILVEPEGGLPAVDREFYVMQGEVYTHADFGQKGRQEFDVQKLLDETPEYFVLNGAVGSLTAQHPLQANVGETVRIFFGVGGPNITSSFHVIGEILDRVYDQASLTSPALTDVQTTLVPPGGATVVEFKVEVPGRYILVDHALSRLERGLAGFLYAEGAENPEVFHGAVTGGSGH